MEKDYKCNITVWEQDSLPEVATFYGDNTENLHVQMHDWMEQRTAESARFTILHRDAGAPDGWKPVAKGVLKKVCELPQFMFAAPSNQDRERFPWIGDNLIIQVTTGRMAAVMPADKEMDGMVTVNLCLQAPTGSLSYKLVFLRMAGTDLELQQRGRFSELEKTLENDFIRPMTRWYLNHIGCGS